MTIEDLEQGDTAIIVGYLSGNWSYKSKYLALGLTRGTRIKVTNVAPLGDPVQIDLRGSSIVLRKKEAGIIQVESHGYHK